MRLVKMLGCTPWVLSLFGWLVKMLGWTAWVLSLFGWFSLITVLLNLPSTIAVLTGVFVAVFAVWVVITTARLLWRIK
jgi:hypothetical protein